MRELVRDRYASGGRPSVDPVVFFKLQLVLFFEELRSERRLMEIAADRLSIRWYLGYDLSEPLPDHSSLTYIRQRYGLEVFRRFFEEIVQLCIEAGLVWGKELCFDSAKVKAHASVNSLVPRFTVEAHLKRLFKVEEVRDAQEAPHKPLRSAVRMPCPQPTTKSFEQRTPRRATGYPGKSAKTMPSSAATAAFRIFWLEFQVSQPRHRTSQEAPKRCLA